MGLTEPFEDPECSVPAYSPLSSGLVVTAGTTCRVFGACTPRIWVFERHECL